MLTDFSIHPSLATGDAARARAWYADRLGIEPFLDASGLLAYQVGSTMFTVFETTTAGTAQNTVMVWRVADLASEMTRLRARGLAFEDLEDGGDRTIDGVGTSTDPFGGPVRNAWFRDGDGNWISLVEQPDHPGEDQPADMGVGLAIAVADLDRARRWYAVKLGLEPLHVLEDELVYRQGQTRFTMFQTPSAGTARNTVGVWRVADLRSEVAALRARGVEFMATPMAGIEPTDGVYADPDGDELAAWFVDSEGNWLGLVEDLREPIEPR